MFGYRLGIDLGLSRLKPETQSNWSQFKLNRGVLGLDLDQGQVAHPGVNMDLDPDRSPSIGTLSGPDRIKIRLQTFKNV